MTRLHFYLDVDTRRLLNSVYAPLLSASQLLLFARDEQCVFCISAVTKESGDWAAYPLTGLDLRLGIKALGSLYGADYLAFADADQVNLAGDWADADLDDGKFSIRVNLNTEEIEDLFESADTTQNVVVEIESLAAAVPTTLAQALAQLKPDVIRNGNEPAEGEPAWLTAPAADARYVRAFAGSVTITAGASSGSVTGLGLPYAPVAVLLTVRIPTASDNVIFAALVGGTLDADGFDYVLSASVPGSGTAYQLDYLCVIIPGD